MVRNNMTREERAIWQAAFGAAFASNFNHTDQAIAIANKSVRELRRWRLEQNSAAGIIVED
jgi:hypothetical protein